MTRGWSVYTQPAAFGSPGHPVSLITTFPATVGTSDAFAHVCHSPARRFPPGVTSFTARGPARFAARAARSRGSPSPTDNPASTKTAATRRSTAHDVPHNQWSGWDDPGTASVPDRSPTIASVRSCRRPGRGRAPAPRARGSSGVPGVPGGRALAGRRGRPWRRHDRRVAARVRAKRTVIEARVGHDPHALGPTQRFTRGSGARVAVDERRLDRADLGRSRRRSARDGRAPQAPLRRVAGDRLRAPERRRGDPADGTGRRRMDRPPRPAPGGDRPARRALRRAAHARAGRLRTAHDRPRSTRRHRAPRVPHPRQTLPRGRDDARARCEHLHAPGRAPGDRHLDRDRDRGPRRRGGRDRPPPACSSPAAAPTAAGPRPNPSPRRPDNSGTQFPAYLGSPTAALLADGSAIGAWWLQVPSTEASNEILRGEVYAADQLLTPANGIASPPSVAAVRQRCVHRQRGRRRPRRPLHPPRRHHHLHPQDPVIDRARATPSSPPPAPTSWRRSGTTTVSI